jgi:MFS family permease
MTAMGVGALAGGLWVAARARPSRRLLVVGTALFGAAAIVAAFMPTIPLEMLVLVPMGACSVLFIATTNSLLQLNSEPSMRGRVMSLWAVVFLGSTPIGSLVVGAIATVWGPRAAFAFGGVAALLTGVVVGWGLRRRGRERLAAAAGEPEVCLPDTPEPDDLLQADVAERPGTARRPANVPGRPTL